MAHPSRHPWPAAQRALRSITLVAAAAAALFAAASALARDAAPGPADRVPAMQAESGLQTPRWSGLMWQGVHAGMPDAPSARDCRRPPQAFDIPGPAGQAQPGRPPVELHGAAPGRGAEARARRSEGAADAAAGGARGAVASERLAALPAPSAAPGPAVAAATAAAPAATGGPAPEAARRPASEPVSAGMVDDNTDFGDYRDYRARWSHLTRRELDISARVRLEVRDGRGLPVPDAQVRVRRDGRWLPLAARSDAGGQAWLMPQPDVQGPAYEVEVSHGGRRSQALWRHGQKDSLQLRLDGAQAAPAQLDIVFMIDATGSMADEIDKLKRSMRAVAEQIARLPSQPDLCFGLVAYRDRGDAFFVRGTDLTHDLAAFQHQLEALQAGGGGDYPEALNEALHTAVHRISWRGEGTARLLVLVADAPPHLDYGLPHYDQDLRAAQARGIKIFSVGASGLDPQGEYIFRQMAQFTGGRFVFLTYARATQPSSGPGRETVHDVHNYSVQTLDHLLVRLVGEEMARWPQIAP